MLVDDPDSTCVVESKLEMVKGSDYIVAIVVMCIDQWVFFAFALMYSLELMLCGHDWCQSGIKVQTLLKMEVNFGAKRIM